MVELVALLDQVAQVGDADGFEAEPDNREIDHREGQLHQLAFADQHSDDHGDAYGGDAHEKHLVPRAAQILVVDRGKDDGADGAHRAGFGRRRKAEHHGAQHHEDQHGRRDNAHQAFAPERPARQRPRFLRNRGDVAWLDEAQDERVAGEQGDLQHRRPPGAEIHVADRLAELVGHHDQHQRGRHQLGDGAGRREHAGDIAHIVAVAEHHRHRDQRHGDDLRRHRAGDRAEDEADDDDGIAEAAADRTEQLAHRIQHVFGETAALEHRAHEGEEGDREQQFVGKHAAEDSPGNSLQEVHVEEAEIDRQESERQPERGQREGHREADQHGQNQAAEHQRRHHLQRDHWVGLSYFASITT